MNNGYRNKKWIEQDTTTLIPGNTINIKSGDIILVNARLTEGDPFKIDQSALTGEISPYHKESFS